MRDSGYRCRFYLFGRDLGGLAGGADLADGVDAGLNHRDACCVTTEELWAAGANQLNLFAAKCGGRFEATLQPRVPAPSEQKIHEAAHLFRKSQAVSVPPDLAHAGQQI